MSLTRRSAAARNGLAAILAVFALVPPPVSAEGGPQLILPLVTALAVASAAARAPQQVATMQGGRRPVLSLLPSQVRFEDGYEIDVEDYIGRRRPVALADADRIASFDVLHHRRRGWMASFVYDEESRRPLRSAGDLIRFVADYRF
ncbi:MAG TPA: hypothetical protein VEM57_02600 [Candidatus Binatus sp.]|nr:hypothetical protein [Candidatus Binatus sp.]